MTQLMNAVLLTGFGGPEKLVYTQVPKPTPQNGEVLIKVGACSVNNMDLNLRNQWYGQNFQEIQTGKNDIFSSASWQHGEGVQLPMIQGADIVGKVIEIGSNVNQELLHQRVIVNPYISKNDLYIGSEINGGFAEYTVIPATNVYPMTSSLSDVEIATFPCSYSTAENMVTKARVTKADTVLITGASGGVGSALIQLNKILGATVIAVVGANKESYAKDLGADYVYCRDEQLASNLTQHQVTVSLDVVGGSYFDILVKILQIGGRYVCSGAIGGPLVKLDLRDLIYKDLQMSGATRLEPEVFPNLVRYIEQGLLKPLVAKVFHLSEIKEAQQFFQSKSFFGKVVITHQQP
ncbi:zinc-binding alcohol dehydrogenase [Candidatus Thiomargarita nelsonii]|uniref:Zinc-binding alcohol dehydrogenase n=1 Tax=Candidatus Thiomargarita nelsonii TaxID=1003181 RepID=A0A0A6PLM4_9GAMM|nr:zinc-binding alcohol dehydrogenase [Candidatus Thiomargarita nelsonii]